VTFATAASKAATALKTLKEAQTVGDIVDTVVGKGGLKNRRNQSKRHAGLGTKVASGGWKLLPAQGVGMAETYRLAKTVPAAASSSAAAEGAR
jgi:hypothetical protein